MRDRQGANPGFVQGNQHRERHRLRGQWRLDVDAIERTKAVLQFGRHLQYDPVGIELGEILSNLALPIGVVERVVDHLGRDAEARGLDAATLIAAEKDLGRSKSLSLKSFE